MAIAAGGVAEAARVTITGAVDENWRGAYDLLVRPAGARLELEATNGVVEPNFLGFAGRGGISLAELEAIRRLPDVAIAAPVSVVGHIEYVAVAPSISTTRYPETAALFRLTLEGVSSDGIGDVSVQREELHWLLGSSADDSLLHYQARSSTRTEDEVDITVEPWPPFTSPVMAVDPGSERALLGQSGSFLDVFGRLPAQGGRDIGSFDTRLIPNDPFRLARLDILGFQAEGGSVAARPVIPIVVSSSIYADLRLRLAIEQLGPGFAEFPTDLPDTQREAMTELVERANGSIVPAGETMIDVSDRLRPFQAEDLTVPWPDTTAPQLTASGVPEGRFEVRLGERPAYGVAAGRPSGPELSFVIEPHDVVSPDGRQAGPDTQERVTLPGSRVWQGREQSYRAFQTLPLAVSDDVDVDRGERPFYLAPLGEFDLATFALPTEGLGYVPLGAYDPPDTVLVADTTGAPLAERPMRPTLNPAGLISTPPLAITDLAGAVTLRGPAPIDAIRVRLAGLSGYDATSRAIVERTASRIAELGLDVDIVAGASPQAVEIYVPAYHVGDDAAAPSDLGWIRQGWTTLGAAERVERGLGQTNLALLLLSLAVAVTFAVVLEVTRLTTRVRETALLKSVGWSRRRIIGWLTGEALVAGSLIAVLGTGAWLLSGGFAAGLVAAVLLALVLPLAALAGAIVAWRGAGLGAVAGGDRWLDDRLLRIAPVAGVGSFALREWLVRPVRTGAVVVALALSACALSLALHVLVGTLARVGPTYLAGALLATLRPYQLVLLVVAGLGGALLTVLALRFALSDRQDELRSLIASGWSWRETKALLARGDLLVGLAALPLAALAAGLMAIPVAGTPPWGPGIVAGALALSVGLWGGLLHRRPEGVIG